jgi:hypothetical protein
MFQVFLVASGVGSMEFNPVRLREDILGSICIWHGRNVLSIGLPHQRSLIADVG